MSVKIQTTVNRTTAASTFAVKFTVIDVVGIGPGVFVFDAENNTYSHVASVYDMETYPSTQSAALSQGVSFYRTDLAEVSYNTINAALEFEAVTKSRLTALAKGWEAATASFDSTEEVFTAESS